MPVACIPRIRSRIEVKIVDKILLTTPNYTKEYRYLVQFEDDGTTKIFRTTKDQIELDIAAIRQEKLKLILN